ncbi:sulfotransferase [Thermoleophilia bacterium SCSIO 60948]|nr:sulfotransferase [Thermoleophilia bacterium SCSIO 60948]
MLLPGHKRRAKLKRDAEKNAPRRRPGRPPAPFIVGVPRSGTTLLRLMLDVHPDLAIPPETHFLPELIIAGRRRGAGAEQLCDLIVEHPRWPDFGLEAADLRERVQTGNPGLRAVLRRFYELYAESQGATRWGDKTPQYAGSMKQIQRVLPEAAFIHLIRDGRDVLTSRTKRFEPQPGRVARQWRRGVRHARRQAPGLNRYIEVRYEDLVLEPEVTLRNVCEFIELDFDPAMLHHEERAEQRMAEIDRDLTKADGDEPRRAEDRRMMHRSTVRAIDPSLVGQWRTRISESQRLDFEAVAGEFLAELGYPVGEEARIENPATSG